MHEVFLKTILLLVKGAEALNLNTQSHDPSHQLSLFCSLFFYDFTKIVFVDNQQAFFVLAPEKKLKILC